MQQFGCQCRDDSCLRLVSSASDMTRAGRKLVATDGKANPVRSAATIHAQDGHARCFFRSVML